MIFFALTLCIFLWDKVFVCYESVFFCMISNSYTTKLFLLVFFKLFLLVFFNELLHYFLLIITNLFYVIYDG